MTGSAPQINRVTQTHFGKGNGNCFSACIASILRIELDVLEEFHRLFLVYCRAFDAGKFGPGELVAHHHELARVTGCASQYCEVGSQTFVPKGLSIATGQGPRDCLHACVALNGQIIHDPHPERTGLLGIDFYEVLVPIVPAPDGCLLDPRYVMPSYPKEGPIGVL